MVPEKYRLAAVGRFLLDAFERRRPGLAAWTPEVEQALLAEAEAELVQMEKQCKELGLNDPEYWGKVRAAIQAVLLPRYAQLARNEIALTRRDYDLWRGGDLVARLAYAGVGLVLGAAAVAIPWIPVTEKWVPWALFLVGPLLPDAQLWFYRRRYQKRVDELVNDLARADLALDTYRPLSELQRSIGEPGLMQAPDAVKDAPSKDAPAEPGSAIGKQVH
ncbi:MAG: hypothetical protein JST92_24340 [Deltaproteobacteria bacterium]|nr:hypothetical protein [Deltaproteobacteria bacterium]